LLPFLIGLLALGIGFVLLRWGKGKVGIVRVAWVICILGVLTIALAPFGNFEIQKFFGKLVMPLGLIWVGWLVTIILSWPYLRRWAKCSFVFLWVAFTICGNNWFGAWLMSSLERQYPYVDPATAEPMDAVCVLGGGTSHRLDERPAFSMAADRLLLGVQLYRHGRTPLLIGSSPSADTRMLWQDMGIPPKAILDLAGPANTSEEIAACRQLQIKYRWKRFGLVTSAAHMPRAMALCRRYGVEMIPLPAAYHSLTPPGFLMHLVPQDNGFMLVQLAVWEYVGRLWGR
jgi:uncharacterized SAM-binding protein YcdF (DUF218 family)